LFVDELDSHVKMEVIPQLRNARDVSSKKFVMKGKFAADSFTKIDTISLDEIS